MKILKFLIFILLVFFCISCKSTSGSNRGSGTTPSPDSSTSSQVPQTPQTPQSPQSTQSTQSPQTPQSPQTTTGDEQLRTGADSAITQPQINALNQSIARAEEAQRRAIDFDSPSYFPSEWEAIEERCAAAGNMPKSTQDEIRQAAAIYDSIANDYDELFRRTIPLYALAWENEIISVREELIETGIPRYFPEYLRSSDETALTALDRYEAGDYYGAREKAAEALNEYEFLLIAAKAYSIREEIVDRGFIIYDSGNFYYADEVALTAIDEYETGNKETAFSIAEETLLRYGVVLANGWTAYAADRRALAIFERDLALTEKANIASREYFRNADGVFNQAEGNWTVNRFQNAAILFMDAEALFIVARYDTDEKRRRALDTIRMAEDKIEDSIETAAEAERIIEGGLR